MSGLPRVLIVDDDTNLLAGLARQLGERFDIVTATSGQAALSLVVTSGPFDAVLCDMRMPGMDGVEVLSRLSQSAPNTVRMMLTGNTDQKTAVDAINRGTVFRFFNKPIPAAVLGDAIEEALRGQRPTAGGDDDDGDARGGRDLDQVNVVLAHHLQEPVRLQMIMTQYLLRSLPRPLNEDVTNVAELIVASAARQRALVHDLQLYLAVTPPAAGASCHTGSALHAALERLGGKIAESGAVIRRGEMADVLIEREQLIKLFTILLDNAIEHRRPDVPPVVWVEAVAAKDEVAVSITDNGIGIPEMFRARVFGLFEQLDPRRDRTGIGLPLARKIVAAARGRIWIEGAPDGPGCAVRVTLRPGRPSVTG